MRRPKLLRKWSNLPRTPHRRDRFVVRAPWPKPPPAQWQEAPRAPWSEGAPGALKPEDALRARPCRVSFVITLPFDIPAANEVVVTALGAGWFAGTDTDHFPPITGLPPMPWPGLRPLTNLWIRRGPILAAEIEHAVLEAFPWLFPHEAAEDGQSLVLTRAVVLVTRVSTVPDLLPDEATDEQQEAAGREWLSDEFDAGLRELNEWLVALASISGEEAIGAISSKELPAGVPFFTSDPLDDLKNTPAPLPELSLLLLHLADDDVVEDISPEVIAAVTGVTRLQRARGHPFLPYAESMTAARRSLRQGRFAQAVLEAGTAIEILVSAAIRNACEARGVPADKIDGITNAPLRSRLEHHLRQAGLVVDLDEHDSPVGAWYRGAYVLRNRVVHEGYRPTEHEAGRAIAEARDVMVAIGRALHADPVTREVGERLVTFRSVAL